jgi:hypothetical protein
METTSADTWLDISGRCFDEQQLLCTTLDACLSCELVCAIAADVAETLDEDAYGKRTSVLLLGCAAVCHATAEAIAQLQDPDVSQVIGALESCRMACANARAECERRPFDPCCSSCGDQCSRVEIACDNCLALVAVSA